jgi:NAD(P)-dependent dehydrogenase (short-subunit alcohol dehydrogenase family)
MSSDLKDMFSLEGKVAVITGGGGVLCGAMARALRIAGCKIAILDILLEKAEEAAAIITAEGGIAKAYAADVLDEANLNAVYKEICSSLGMPDIIINGAGGNNPKGSTKAEFLEPGAVHNPENSDFFDLDFEGVRKTFDLNFLGTFLPSKVFSRGMVEKGKGSILNISSMGAFNPLTQVGAYSAAKAAVASFTKWLAVHFAHAGVRVNALAPGFFMTEQLRFLHIDQTTGEPTPRSRKVIAHTPMGRYGNPEDLMGAVIYLLSDSASFVTGSILAIDGGFSSYSI